MSVSDTRITDEKSHATRRRQYIALPVVFAYGKSFYLACQQCSRSVYATHEDITNAVWTAPVMQRGYSCRDNRPLTLYAVSTGRHDIRDYDIFESPQPWYRPTPVTNAEYVGKLSDHTTWRNFHFNYWDTYGDIWKVFERRNIPHLRYWTGYHMVSDNMVQGIDAYFQYWCQGTPPSDTWEWYWLLDSAAVCMTCTL